MESIAVKLTSSQFSKLNSLFNQSGKSADVGKRAVEIVKIYFMSKNPRCTFPVPPSGVDLVVQENRSRKKLEIKGTSELNIAWGKLGVSGCPSFDKLKKGMPLYRVTGVFEETPQIYVLRFKKDFRMQKEPRWRIVQTTSNKQEPRTCA